MALPSRLRSAGRVLAHGLDWVSNALAFYAVPLAIAIVSFLALYLWQNLYSAQSELLLELRVLPPSGENLAAADAKRRLADAPTSQFFNTKLSELPVWFSAEIPAPSSVVGNRLIELPSRHAVGYACWDGKTLEPIGGTASFSANPIIYRAMAGYAMSVGETRESVICRASFVGPARLSAELWNTEKFSIAERDYHRESGLIDGGLLVLAIFVLISAVFNRERLYLVFSAWLLVTARLSATSGGWDAQWLNHAVPIEWLALGRSFTRAAWALLTVTLFKELFKDDLQRMRYAFPVTILQWLCMLLFVAAAVLPRHAFLPTMWGLGIVWAPFFVYFLARIVLVTRNRVAILYASSLAVTLISTLFEIFSASLGAKGLDDSVNTVIVTLTSGLLISLAIAEQMRQEHKARLAAQAELQHTYDAIPIGMFTLDLQGQFTNINPALRRMLGPRAFKTYQHTWQQYFGVECWHRMLDLVQFSDDGEMEFRSQIDITGSEIPRRYLVKAALAGDKIEGSLQDVTEKSVAAEELTFLADNDALTKVLNRRGLEKVFNELAAHVDDDHPMAFAYLDLDRFKLINELYGHNAGDEVLRQFCQRVNSVLSGQMRLGRVGGDQFVILMPDTRIPLATVISRGVVSGIDERPFRVGEKAFHVRVSIGLIEVTRGNQLKEVISTADHACREAKLGQHRGLVVYERDTPAFHEHQEEIRLIGEISASEVIDRLFLEMQPIMSLTRPYDALNFEVLLRMHDVGGGLVPISRLLSAAEHSGKMSVIDRWVLTHTIAWLDQNRAKLQRTQFVCVNLSGASLNDEEFMQEVFDILRRNSHVSSYLSIEITESVALHDLQNTRRFIDRVRTFGARVALDDFGAGYTSFSYLKELPADLLKIDGKFVVNMNHHPANVSIVEAIVNLARNLGMKTIAEWAEDAATVQALSEIGVDYVQGYAIARPMAPERLLEGASAASFVKDESLQRFLDAIDRQHNPLAQLDLLQDGDKPAPPKIH